MTQKQVDNVRRSSAEFNALRRIAENRAAFRARSMPEPHRGDLYIPLVRTVIAPEGAVILGSMGCAPPPG